MCSLGDNRWDIRKYTLTAFIQVPYSLESTPTSERTPTPLFSPKFHLKAFLLRLYTHLKIYFTEHEQSFHARVSMKQTKTT